MGVHITTVVVKKIPLANHQVKLIEHIIEESFVDLQQSYDPQEHIQHTVFYSIIKDQSNLNDESQVLFHDSNDELQWPCQILCDLVNDEYILVSYDLAVVFDEIQENSEPLSILDRENEKHFSLIPFVGNQFQHIDKPTLWNKVCFPTFNHWKDHMLHAFHDLVVNLFHSSVEEEFSKFVNTGIGFGKKLSCNFRFSPACSRNVWVGFQWVAICWIGYTGKIISHDCTHCWVKNKVRFHPIFTTNCYALLWIFPHLNNKGKEINVKSGQNELTVLKGMFNNRKLTCCIFIYKETK